LKRLLKNPGKRNNQSSLIPDPNNYICSSNFLNAPPLFLNDYHVIQADWSTKSELQTRHKIFNGWPGCQTEHQASDSRGSKQAGSKLPNHGKGHQYGGHTKNQNNNNQGSSHKLKLRMHMPRSPIISDIDAVLCQNNSLNCRSSGLIQTYTRL